MRDTVMLSLDKAYMMTHQFGLHQFETEYERFPQRDMLTEKPNGAQKVNGSRNGNGKRNKTP